MLQENILKEALRLNCHLYFGRRRILIPERSEKIPSSRVELNSQPSEF